MSARDQVWVGADPGGKKGFGVAVVRGDGSANSSCVSCTDDAMAWLLRAIPPGTGVAGVGIDAPLWWSSGPSSDRVADQWIRKTYGLSGGEVQTANSLRGAALVQGAMFATRIRDRFPSVPITEAHPKVVMKVLRAKTWARFARQFSVVAPPRPSSDHERDATISAVSAREGFEGRWKRDLSLERGLSEQDPQAYWLAPVRYFWPET